MRKLVIIFGINSGTIIKYCQQAFASIEHIKMETSSEPDKALREVLKKLKEETEGHYERAVVLYAGHNLHLLSDNSPCDAINLFDLYSKLKEVVGGDQTLQQQDILRWLLTGAVKELPLH